MNTLKRLNGGFCYISRKLGAFVMMLLIINVTLSVIFRYFLNRPFSWTEELCTFLFICFSFLGATVATYEKRHVSVDFVTSRLPEAVNRIIKLISNCLIMVFLAMLVIGSFILFPSMTHTSVALNIPRWCYYVPVMCSSVMMFCMYMADTIEFIGNWLEKNKEVAQI